MFDSKMSVGKILGFLFLILIMAILFSKNFLKCKGQALCFYSTLKKYRDADSFLTQTYEIRLSLVDAPEIEQTDGIKALEFVKKICPEGSLILVDQDDLQKFDRYGRIIAKVYCKGKNLNEELVKNGYAKVLKEFCNQSEFSNESWVNNFC
jgi:micrococcal nuclease